MVDSKKSHLLQINCTKLTNLISKTIISLILLLLSNLSFSATAVIVHPDNSNQLKHSEIRKIFLGKVGSFANGNTVTPIDLNDENPNKAAFMKKVLRKSQSSLNAYWSRMMFSSKGLPPKSMSEEQVKAEVANNKSAIAYISKDNVDNSVKVVLLLED